MAVFFVVESIGMYSFYLSTVKLIPFPLLYVPVDVVRRGICATLRILYLMISKGLSQFESLILTQQ